MRILCVAEKPAMSKSLAQILSQGQYNTSPTEDKYTRNYEFSYKLANNTLAHVVMTAVRGHLLGSDFPQRYRKWGSCAPVELFEMNIEKSTTSDLIAVERNLVKEAQLADQLMIWTDCDREGENIGAEIMGVCLRRNQRLVVTRARFSSVTPAELHRAMRNPTQLDMRQACAVDARIELDLRIGASFTRFQTLAFQSRFPQLGGGVISYGPCQFPTLGFVVDQYHRVESFIPETFWNLEMKHKKDNVDATFTWERGRLFNQLSCLVIYEACIESAGPTAQITRVKSQPTKKWKPLPLTTVELQKNGSRFLSISSDLAAENLYTKGWISYPRTETDQFDPNYDLRSLVEKQTHNRTWGNFAQGLMEGGFRTPRKGKNNDQAHPPIHPVMHTETLDGNEKKVYEFIVRRFLACCADDAKGDQTEIEAQIHSEKFRTTGLIIKERNYLDVYPYDKWTGNVLPHFEEGEAFIPTEFTMKTGATTPPKLLTESQLIALMDKNGIGTDATIAEHIKVITQREYVVRSKREKEYVFTPSTLGIALVEGYDNIGLEMSLSKPLLRSQLESNLKLICEGTKSKEEVVQEAIEMYRNVFEIINRDKRVLEQSLEHYLGGPPPDMPPQPPRAPPPRPLTEPSGGSSNNHESTNYGSRTFSNNNSSNRFDSNSGGQFSASTNRTLITCLCEGNPPAVERRVVKEGENQGRLFHICAKPREKQCSFFKFSDTVETSTRPAMTRMDGNQHNSNQNRAGRDIMDAFHANLSIDDDADMRPKCQCGLIAIKAQSKKNDGRAYWTCSKQKKCRFFVWDDERGQERAPNNDRLADMECYSCHQMGHFANMCPASSSGTSSSRAPNQSWSDSASKATKMPKKRGVGSRAGVAAMRTIKPLMPPEPSNQRGRYARREATDGQHSGRGRGGNANGYRNRHYPGRSQNPDNHNKNGGKRWGRPRTSTVQEQENDSFGAGIGMAQAEDAEEEVNMPMVRADELPSQTAERREIQQRAGSAQGVAPKGNQREDCPWIDWDVYFPQEDYHPEHEYMEWIKELCLYLQDYLNVHTKVRKISTLDDIDEALKRTQLEIERRGVIVVNLKTLALACNIPEFIDLTARRPLSVMGCIALAALQVMYGEVVAKEQRKRPLRVRFAGFDRLIHGKDLKANLIGKLVCIRGTVVRVSGVKPLATRLAFSCNACQSVQTIDFPDAKFSWPARCLEVGCKGRQFTPQRGVEYDTETVDWQTIRLQEKLPDDRNDSGRVPRTIECEVTKDLVDRVIPGDVIEVTGIVKVTQAEKAAYMRAKTGNTMYLLYLDVNYITKATTTKEEDDVYDDEETNSKEPSKDSIQITTKDLYAIEEVHMEPQLFKLIVNSFSPAIFGHEMVKAGILFALFGGRRRSKTAVDRTTIRSDPHVLVVGDPGLGKSQMLSAAVKAAPRGVYVCGSSGISTSGLTVTLVRGAGSDFALEAGALVLGDQGCCCIDEFDKMTTDHNALLEAMEQQSISIAKAGIICTLPARTSVIAAANPVGGHYNMSKTVAENLKMNTALLSRFDLIFILMDKPDGEMDQYLSRHVMALHSGNVINSPAFRTVGCGTSQENQDDIGRSQKLDQRVKYEPNTPLSERLRMTNEDNLELVPLPLLRKYIAYARKYVHPRLSPEAASTLQEFYLMLRAQHRSPDGTPVTTRQLESLIRMAEAKARLELREVVTRRDAMDVIEIMTFSLRDTYGPLQHHPEANQSQTQSGRGKTASMKRYVAELQRRAFDNSSNMFSQDQLYKTFQDMRLSGITGGFQSFLDMLNSQNFLLKKGPRTYQLTTVM
ncbi:DNA topoisomerase [Lunasporangiospora selenospora]|uniref:Minichromosome maintenance 8 n=1 Tax=Lunasporangiospora selenospora TaxID=979761 RepID=A0A9P6KI99_9FUNG|nr:DNA topoisomerase [Lunasporangiospora selenospora]